MENTLKKPLLQAALGQKTDRQPIWFLRQAGRYLPEYREIRAQMGFLEHCRNPEKAAEVTLQPLKRFDLDGSIIFSDILIPPTALGQELTFEKNHGPVLKPAIQKREDLAMLKKVDANKDLGYVGEAIALTKAKLGPTQTMIGFAGAPFTVASYMIEGSGSKTYTQLKTLLFRDPDTLRDLLKILAEVTTDYLQMQVDAGAEIVMLFDSWAGDLTPFDYEAIVAPNMRLLVEEFRKNCDVPVVYFPGQSLESLKFQGDIGADVIHVHWKSSLKAAWEQLGKGGGRPSLQGNLDPQVFLGNEEVVRSNVRRILEEASSLELPGHIFNIGHGLMPHTPIQGISWAIDEIRNWKA